MASVASPQEKFDAAVQVIHSLPKNGSFQPSHAMMLTFYGLYKQATCGQCNVSKPAFWDVVGKYKWEAWNRLGTMRREQAMLNYVDELKKIIETMPHTENVQGFVEKLGDFYELVDDETSKGPLPTLIKNASPKKKFAPPASSIASDGGGLMNAGEREEITRLNGKASLNGSGRRGGSESSDHSPSSDNNSSDHSHVLDGDEDLSESVIVAAHDDHGYYTNGSNQTDAGLYSNISSTVLPSGDARGVSANRVRDNDDSEHDSTPNSSSTSSDTDHHDDDDDDEFCDTSDISHIPTGDGSMAALFGSAAPSEVGQSWVLEPSMELNVDTTSSTSHNSSRLFDQRDGTTPSVTTAALDTSDLAQSPSASDLVVGRGGGDRPGEPGGGGARRASGASTTGRGASRTGGTVGGGASGGGVGQSGSRSDQRLLGASGGSGGDVPGHRPLHRTSVVEQVSVALIRLQQDMDSVITRLQSLESLSLAQHQIVVARSRHNSGQSHGSSSAARWWRPFQRMNASTVAFLILWPFFAQFLVRFISARGRRLRR